MRKGLNYLDSGLPVPACTWPAGSSSLPASGEQELGAALRSLQAELLCPPRSGHLTKA